ncbi:hypothetical protein B566_EDAN016185 [Ephemera danica]|nr:hypothetical protein B566_EDAN016185 [Ephemera danica]
MIKLWYTKKLTYLYVYEIEFEKSVEFQPVQDKMNDGGGKSNGEKKKGFFANHFGRKDLLLKKNHITREPLQLGLCVKCDNTAVKELTIDGTKFSLCKPCHMKQEHTGTHGRTDPGNREHLKLEVCVKCKDTAVETIIVDGSPFPMCKRCCNRHKTYPFKIEEILHGL